MNRIAELHPSCGRPACFVCARPDLERQRSDGGLLGAPKGTGASSPMGPVRVVCASARGEETSYHSTSRLLQLDVRLVDISLMLWSWCPCEARVIAVASAASIVDCDWDRLDKAG